MKAVIYARVSTKEQSPEVQIEICKKKVQKEGWELIEVFQENKSGRKGSRPELYKMMDRVRQGDVDVVIVTRIARLGRRFDEVIHVVLELNNRGIRLIAEKMGIDTGTPMGRYFTYSIMALSELEGELIAERTQEKIDSLKEKGVKLGRRSSVDPSTQEGKWRISRILNLRKEDPSISLRKISKVVGISRETVRKVLNEWELSRKGTPVKVDPIE